MTERTKPDESVIEGFLKICGQEFEKADTGLWDIVFEGPTGTFYLVIELGQEYLTMVVQVEKDVRPDCLANLSYHLARLNNNIDMARFSLNKRHEVLLALEMPLTLLEFSDFQKNLLMILRELGRCYEEIRLLSQDPEKASSFFQQG